MIDKTLVYYVAGQMRPLPDHNFPMFERACKLLRADGYKIVSPHEMGDETMARGVLMAEDIAAILFACGGLIHLEGFEASPGASAEVAVAFATEKPVLSLKMFDDGTYNVQPSDTMTVSITREQQYAEKWPLVGLCGFAQSGKDTTAEHLVTRGWTRVAFADTLREVLYALNPIIEGHYYPEGDGVLLERVVEIVDRKGWDVAKVEHPEIRALLQRLGTEAGREIIDQQMWVRKGEEKIERAGGPVVITDCRFPNEVNMVRRRKGTLVWIERPGNQAANAHASEHSITQADCDFTIVNSGTIEELENYVDSALVLNQRGNSWENVSGIEAALSVSV